MNTPPPDIVLAEYWLRNGDIQRAKALLIEIAQTRKNNSHAKALLAQILTHEGNLSLESGNPIQAINFYQLSLEKSGASFEALHNLGLAHAQLFQYAKASQFFKEACLIESNSFEAQMNYGSCLKNLGLYEESLQHLCIAEKLNPDDARVYLNKGVTLESLGRPQEAIKCYETAIKFEPHYLEAHTNKANALLMLGRHMEAEKAYATALEIHPTDPDTHYNLSLLQLAQGNYEQGWKNYEYRWLRENAPIKSFTTLPELVDLEKIDGMHLLIWVEQGLGDTLQFCRYIPTLKHLGAHITFGCTRPLIDLLKNIEGVEKIITLEDSPPHPCEAQASLMSLPHLFLKSKIQPQELHPYIKSDPVKKAFWNKKLEGEKKLRVGIVWNGGFLPNKPESWPVNSRRNIPFALIAKLQHISGIQFYSLQKGEPAESELLLNHSTIWPKNNLTILTNELKDFSDTAALIDNLDLVISVDTSIAHLAGALGKPVWILNRFDSCWRWHIQQEKTSWYPSARIFNQPSLADWESVIRKVTEELQTLTNTSER